MLNQHLYYQALARKQQTLISTFLIGILCLLLTGCGSIDTMANTSTTGSASATITPGPGVQGVKLFVEPDAGDQVIVNAIMSARKAVWLEMYLLTDRKVINALEDAAHNGVDVRVMLETHPYGSGTISPKETLDKLKAAGVKAQSTSPLFALTHEKGMLIDNNTAYIMTCNFTLSALGGNSTTTNREYGLIDSDPQDVQAITSIFNTDWQQTNAKLSDANLVVSPENSRSAFVTLINNAQKTLLIEAEEMQDGEIEQALATAAKRGVQVQVILPAPGSGSSDDNRDGVNTIKQGGVQVKEDGQLYMHAKLIVADGLKAFVGSENISTASLNRNRELGILVADQIVLGTLQQTFQQDWNDSRAV